MDWEGKERDIGHFQSYMHTQNTCHSQTEVDSGWEGKRHWSLLIIHVLTKHNSPLEVEGTAMKLIMD